MDYIFGVTPPIEDPDPELTHQIYSVSVGDIIDYSGYSNFSTIQNIVDENISNQADTSTPGTYIETYEASDGQGTIESIQVTVLVLDNYYNNAVGLYGNDLELALRTIITSYTYVSYDDARYILDETDQDPNNPDNVILVYSQASISGVWSCPVGESCSWNREHVWPQSWLNYDSTMSADLHNLKPSDPSYNSSRSNKYFGNTTTPELYAPPAEVKGDIARILFYMVIMYDELTLIEANQGTIYEMGNLAYLLDWHEQDVVDDFERNRNDVIYSYQNNRNPFIDYPDFYTMIYDESFNN